MLDEYATSSLFIIKKLTLNTVAQSYYNFKFSEYLYCIIVISVEIIEIRYMIKL